jgi:hypothetical protein
MFVRKGNRADEIDWGRTFLVWGLGLAVIKLAMMGLLRAIFVLVIIAASIGGVVMIYKVVSWTVSANRRRLAAPPPVAMLPPPK